jgi:hypothetical protein
VGAALSFVSMDLAVYPLIAMLVGTFAFGWGANYLNIKFS